MHADDVGKYEGPPCEICRVTQFVGTCSHRPRRQPDPIIFSEADMRRFADALEKPRAIKKQTRRELWEEALQEGPRLRKLALLLLDYIDLISAELDETAPMASLHGWKSSRVEEGERLRAAIEKYGSEKGEKQ